MDLWNVKNLEPPPIISSKTDAKEIDVKFLNGVLRDATDFFENQQHLHAEAALLSRMIYRMKMKFRSSKDFKALEKLERALKTYLYLEISKVLRSFLESVPQNYEPHETYLPTKHMIDFVLVKIQSLGKVSARILGTCKIISDFAHQRLRLGHFWKIALLCYGMSARIFVITKALTKYTCELYANLLPFSSKLNNVGKQWLPDGYVLPESLDRWLDIDWVDLETTVIEIPDDEPDISYFNLIDDSDDEIEFCDEYIIVKDDESSALEISDGKSEDENVIEIIDQNTLIDNCINDVDEIISLSDIDTPKQAQSNGRKKINHQNGMSLPSTLTGFGENVDIGEVVNVNDIDTPSPQSTKTRKRNHGKNIQTTGYTIDTVGTTELINLSDIETPKTKKRSTRKSRKRKLQKHLESMVTDQTNILDDSAVDLIDEVPKKRAKITQATGKIHRQLRKKKIGNKTVTNVKKNNNCSNRRNKNNINSVNPGNSPALNKRKKKKKKAASSQSTLHITDTIQLETNDRKSTLRASVRKELPDTTRSKKLKKKRNRKKKKVKQ